MGVLQFLKDLQLEDTPVFFLNVSVTGCDVRNSGVL